MKTMMTIMRIMILQLMMMIRPWSYKIEHKQGLQRMTHRSRTTVYGTPRRIHNRDPRANQIYRSCVSSLTIPKLNGKKEKGVVQGEGGQHMRSLWRCRYLKSVRHDEYGWGYRARENHSSNHRIATPGRHGETQVHRFSSTLTQQGDQPGCRIWWSFLRGCVAQQPNESQGSYPYLSTSMCRKRASLMRVHDDVQPPISKGLDVRKARTTFWKATPFAHQAGLSEEKRDPHLWAYCSVVLIQNCLFATVS